jgi:hypothetical protein
MNYMNHFGGYLSEKLGHCFLLKHLGHASWKHRPVPRSQAIHTDPSVHMFIGINREMHEIPSVPHLKMNYLISRCQAELGMDEGGNS